MDGRTVKWLRKWVSLNRDGIERVAWTTVQVAIPFIAVELTKLPLAYAPVGTVVLAFIKSAVAKNLGATPSAGIPETPPEILIDPAGPIDGN